MKSKFHKAAVAQRNSIIAQIENLQSQVAALDVVIKSDGGNPAKTGKRKKMSAVVRKKMSDAAKKRWADKKKVAAK